VRLKEYKDCKFLKLSSWVEIGPESPWLLKFLFDFVYVTFPHKESKKKNYNWITLFGIEESQTIPVWPHKSIERSQFKVPFDVNEL